jgi:SNF2 family DNA or RNA helicase
VLVVHGVWHRGRLLLWGEDATAAAPAPRRSGGISRHPYAVAPPALAAAVDLPAVAHAADQVVLHLPTRGGAPVASPELVRDEPEPTGRLTLRRWRVPALAYQPDQALPVLRALATTSATTRATTRAALGAAARWLATLGEFATDLVARGRLLPTLEVDGPDAVWRPVLTGADAAWAQSLALAMPPAARSGGDEPAGEVLAAALDALTDAAARAVLPAQTAPEPPTATVTGAPAAWRRALTGTRRRFRGDPAQVRALAAELAAWQRDAVGGAVRACFQLVEPTGPVAGEPAEPAWTLRFGLQAVDEPSLVVDADRLWRAGGGQALARRVSSPQETLLAELGRASRLYGELEPALHTARPTGWRLDTAGAHHFLTHGAPVLAAAGFGVLLPSWWTRPRARLGARVHARAAPQPGQVAGESGVGFGNLVDFEWRLALGDQELSDQELAELTRAKAPLVRLRGQWVQVDPRRLAAALERLDAAGSGSADLATVLRQAAGDGEGPGGLPVTGVTATGWLEELLSGTVDHRLAPAREPDGFAATLRPYQRRGLAWLRFLQQAGLGGILADDMGLGKTAQALALVAGDRDQGPTLLVCPMSLVGNWRREAARFVPDLRVHVHHGGERARGEALTAAATGADLVITTYALVARDATELGAIRWGRVIVDEAQAIKNAATRQAEAVRALPARHRIALTGTPVENRLADLWSIMEFTNPGLLGTAAAFRKRYAEPVERHGDEQAAARLRAITRPLILRRLKTDRDIISDLPEKLEMAVVCHLTGEQASLYQAVVDDMLARIDGSEDAERRGLVLATMTKLKQVCNHPAHLLRDGGRLAGRSGKLARLEEILDEVLAAGEKALLFTQYAEFGAMVRGHLSARFGREVAWLHGGVPAGQRDRMVARFSSGEPGAPALFVLSLKAGGTGLNLTAANHVVHVDRWWNPAVEDQATDRAFRIGQRRDVQVRTLVCAGTVEEKIAALIDDKRGLADTVVGAGEQWLAGLSTAQLRQLFTLDDTAVVE